MSGTTPLQRKLYEQSGFQVDHDGNVEVGGQWINIELELLTKLVASWCISKNRNQLFSHQASKQILEDFQL